MNRLIPKRAMAEGVNDEIIEPVPSAWPNPESAFSVFSGTSIKGVVSTATTAEFNCFHNLESLMQNCYKFKLKNGLIKYIDRRRLSVEYTRYGSILVSNLIIPLSPHE